MPVERTWTVPEDHGPELAYDEDGGLLITPRVVADDDPDALHEAIYEAIAILRRVGGTIQLASQRAEIAPKVAFTESYIFAYNSFTPLVRKLWQEQAAADPDALTEEEIAQHFPDQPPIVEQAAAEEPALADDELERAGTVVE